MKCQNEMFNELFMKVIYKYFIINLGLYLNTLLINQFLYLLIFNMCYKIKSFKNIEIIKIIKVVNINNRISFRECHVVSFVTDLYRVAKAD